MADRLNVNPYYLGYAFAMGAKSIDEIRERDGHNGGFMIWNSRRWSEQAGRERLPRDIVTIADGAVERHIDLIASYVPAAWDCPREIREIAGYPLAAGVTS